MLEKNKIKISILDKYNKALELYKKREFKKALDGFQKVLEVMPDDEPSKLYVERCQVYIKEPPSDDWDGVFVMTNK